MFPPFLKRGIESTVDDYVEALDYVINLVGEDCVGVGTDHTQGYGQDFFDHITLTRARAGADRQRAGHPKGITIGEILQRPATRRWAAPAGSPSASSR